MDLKETNTPFHFNVILYQTFVALCYKDNYRNNYIQTLFTDYFLLQTGKKPKNAPSKRIITENI